MVDLAIKLPKNNSAGFAELRPFCTVSQRPPKNKTPSPKPASNTSNKIPISFMLLVIFLLNILVFLLNPVPGKNTPHQQPRDQQTQSPGKILRVVFIQPYAQGNAQYGGHCNGPANHPEKAQTIPLTSFISSGFHFPFLLLADNFLK